MLANADEYEDGTWHGLSRVKVIRDVNGFRFSCALLASCAVTTAEWANAAADAATGRCRRHQHRFVHRKRCVADRTPHRHTANTARPNYTTTRRHGEVVRQKATGHGGRRMVIRYHQSAQRRRHVAAKVEW
uniref:Uncharacterized protein n=1 Tax=Anopheles melas TaxID=34690 RepID=A0A182TXE2_9DIPT